MPSSQDTCPDLFLNKVPLTGSGAKDVTPSFVGAGGGHSSRQDRLPTGPTEQGILQTREGFSHRTRKMRHIGCRVPDCISRGEVAVPTWRASARGRWVPLPRPHPPHGSSPTAHRPPPLQKASCRGRSGILETPAENWVGLGFGGCQRLAGRTVTRPRRLLFCRQAACEWRMVKGRGLQAPLPWPV